MQRRSSIGITGAVLIAATCFVGCGTLAERQLAGQWEGCARPCRRGRRC